MHMIHIKELFQHAEQYYDQTIQKFRIYSNK